MSCGSRPTSSASPACRWSRAPRSGAYDPASGRYTLYAGGGAIVRPKKELAIILGLEPEQVRVIAKEVGGNFGTRNFLYPEFVLVAWAAKKIGRPVKWTCERGEAFAQRLCRPRSRGSKSELAMSADGRFLGLHATATSNVGAYTASYIPLTKGTQLMTSLYRHAGGGAGARRCSATPSAPRPIAAPAGPRPCS